VGSNHTSTAQLVRYVLEGMLVFEALHLAFEIEVESAGMQRDAQGYQMVNMGHPPVLTVWFPGTIQRVRNGPMQAASSATARFRLWNLLSQAAVDFPPLSSESFRNQWRVEHAILPANWGPDALVTDRAALHLRVSTRQPLMLRFARNEDIPRALNLICHDDDWRRWIQSDEASSTVFMVQYADLQETTVDLHEIAAAGVHPHF